MPSPPEHPDDDPEHPDDDEAGGSYLTIEAIDRDLERDLRREAEELLERLRPLADSHLADSVMPDEDGGLRPA
jgi:hypothetical protein